jgi:hypothetical protein
MREKEGILPIEGRQEFDRTGAVDWRLCPFRGGRNDRCRCGEFCERCGEPKHMAIHGPLFGEPDGSIPYGHRFVARGK